VVALQAIFEEWNQNTPNVAANLQGWNVTGLNQSYPYPCFIEVPWKGVLCLECVNPNISSTDKIKIIVVEL
jgi:hypothetical protein